ncbi:MAG: DegT/DnrJ/EryC1/StrS family aminotransferase [Treponema sp.]|jgi:dTDP-4-amino-4,6-dideoxygalactose transaminase|nr:DegT/DnrJ/EryC1/StrS family aminotransferase [Treponema sp.]
MKIEVYSPTIRRKEMDAVLTAMVEDQIGPGERSRLLLQTAKESIRFDFALALRSPATALHLALKALELKEGDGVLISALSPRYYAQVLADLRLTPLFCDVSYSFPCISRESIEKAITAKPSAVEPRCVILHHTLGFVPDAASVAGLGIPVIEDISQSYSPPLAHETGGDQAAAGAESAAAGAAAGQTIHGVFGILGLEERDMLTGGGGAILFAMNRKDGQTLRAFSNIPPEYCLPDINAALASVQFREAPRNMARRQEIAKAYIQASLRTKHKRFVQPDGGGGAPASTGAMASAGEYCNYVFPLVLETGMKDVAAYARKKEIIVESAFEQSLAGAGVVDSVLCPVSYSLSLRTVLFPLYPRLRSQEAERVSRLIMTLP